MIRIKNSIAQWPCIWPESLLNRPNFFLIFFKLKKNQCIAEQNKLQFSSYLGQDCGPGNEDEILAKCGQQEFSLLMRCKQTSWEFHPNPLLLQTSTFIALLTLWTFLLSFCENCFCVELILRTYIPNAFVVENDMEKFMGSTFMSRFQKKPS